MARFLVLLALASAAAALTFDISPHKEECFYEELKMGEKMSVSFQVQSGGSLDIDVVIKAPDERIVYRCRSGDRETEGRYSFVAGSAGPHRVCFSNKMSTLTPKTVSFTVVVGESSASMEGFSKGDLDPLETSILQLSDGLAAVQAEQKYMRARERVHRNTSVTMAMWQIISLRGFFEKTSTV